MGLLGATALLTLAAQPAAAQRFVGHGGWHSGYWHGGWHGGWGWRGGYWHPWYPALGLGLGLYFATLPYYYSTYYYGGVPYYYAGNTFYSWDAGRSQYVTVAPPDAMLRGVPATSATSQQSDVIAYPANGQTQEQLGRDKFECHKWAVGQTGFDPTQAGGGAAPAKRGEYFRAQSACLEGRGYTVK
jgi:hypothetical protein